MATQTEGRNRSTVAAVDDPTEAQQEVHARIGGESIDGFIDEVSLEAQTERAVKQNRAETRGFRQYQKKVIEKAGVRNTHQIRQLTSDCCGSVARLSAMPDKEIEVELPGGAKTTEWELQVKAIAETSCSTMQGEQVFIVTAMKLSRAALELREQDPDGSKGIAWVNDTREDEGHVLDD